MRFRSIEEEVEIWRVIIDQLKIVPDVTYNVFDGTLNLAQSINL